MSKAYRVVQRRVRFGADAEERIVYTVVPVSYGVLSTEEVARQISEESAMTAGDVKAVLDRYAYYVGENLRKGYSIELLGFGTLSLRFLKERGVDTAAQADAKLVRRIVPAFRPSYKKVNGSRVYNLVSKNITLVKYNPEDDTAQGAAEEPQP